MIKNKKRGIPALFCILRFISVNAKFMRYEKIYVEVTVIFTENGEFFPVNFDWFGQRITIDKVTERKKAPPEHVGAYLTDVFVCKIRGKERKIYFEREENRWFIEARCKEED